MALRAKKEYARRHRRCGMDAQNRRGKRRLPDGRWLLTYGYRHEPYGQRALLSRDGLAWSEELILRDDGPDGDLGYPASVELNDGSILTVYYQRLPGDTQTSVLSTRWRLPAMDI